MIDSRRASGRRGAESPVDGGGNACRAVLFCAVWSAAAPAMAFSWDDLWRRPDQQAAGLYEEGEMKGAARKFFDDQWRAAAWYKAGEYDRVVRALADDDSIRAHYNRGNALAKSGRLSEAVAAYDEVLRRVPGHEDARHNRDLVESIRSLQEGQGGTGDEASGEPDGQGEPGQGESGDAAGEDAAGSSGETEENGVSMMESSQRQGGQGEDGAESADQPDQPAMAAGEADDPGEEGESAAMMEQAEDGEREKGDTDAIGRGEEEADPEADSVLLSRQRRQQDEKRMAVDLWLRDINATDSVFLRRKFQRQHNLKRRKQ